MKYTGIGKEISLLGRREENKMRKRKALEEAGLRLFCARGFSDTSVGLIVAEANVARGTFYLYFEDKLVLFQALIRRLLDPLLGSLDACSQALQHAKTPHDPLAAYLILGEAVTACISTLPQHTLLYVREQRVPNLAGIWLLEQARDVEERVFHLVQDATARGFLRAADPSIVVWSILGALDRITMSFLDKTLQIPPSQVVWEVARLFGEGLLAGQVSYQDLSNVQRPTTSPPLLPPSTS